MQYLQCGAKMRSALDQHLIQYTTSQLAGFAHTQTFLFVFRIFSRGQSTNLSTTAIKSSISYSRRTRAPTVWRVRPHFRASAGTGVRRRKAERCRRPTPVQPCTEATMQEPNSGNRCCTRRLENFATEVAYAPTAESRLVRGRLAFEHVRVRRHLYGRTVAATPPTPCIPFRVDCRVTARLTYVVGRVVWRVAKPV
jgi:hypothetical protein